MSTAALESPSNAVAVFLGTSLPHEAARGILPIATFHPPIARDDLREVVEQGARVVGIIDGVFHQAFPVSPREIRSALQAGIRIFGASSMGALRAAEMHPAGMSGVGKVFEWYKSGYVDADDEVALVFDPDTFRNLSVPLVNMRHAFVKAVEQRVISAEVGTKLLEIAKLTHYPDLNYRRVIAELDEELMPDGYTWATLAAFLETFDLKRDDAIVCLEAIRELLDAEPELIAPST